MHERVRDPCDPGPRLRLQTLYGHLSALKVRAEREDEAWRIRRPCGEHGAERRTCTEVHKGEQPVDPANYFFNDLTPEEYARMLDISRNSGQSLD